MTSLKDSILVQDVEKMYNTPGIKVNFILIVFSDKGWGEWEGGEAVPLHAHGDKNIGRVEWESRVIFPLTL